MKIISFADTEKNVASALAEKILRDGGVVAVPTDTVYGLVALADNTKAIEHIFQMKNRALEKALPIFVENVSMARWYAYISDTKAEFLNRVWPGALTVVFHHKEKLPPRLTGEGDTIGMRMPDSPFILDILSRIHIPLAQTSANISGMPPAKSAEEVAAYFEEQKYKPDLVIDGGEKITGGSSTIIDFTANEPRLLRAGAMSKEELELIVSKIGATDFR